MLFHIRPRLYSPFKAVALVDLELWPFGMNLAGGTDLKTGRPYPNKRYAVACRKQWRRCTDGILIRSPMAVREFGYRARWAVAASLVVEHHVTYRLLDADFAAASDDMTLWYACSADLGGWSLRRPSWWIEGRAPTHSEPLMEILPGERRPFNAIDTIDVRSSWIVRREQRFEMPTLEPERILNCRLNDRMPAPAMEFTI